MAPGQSLNGQQADGHAGPPGAGGDLGGLCGAQQQVLKQAPRRAGVGPAARATLLVLPSFWEVPSTPGGGVRVGAKKPRDAANKSSTPQDGADPR